MHVPKQIVVAYRLYWHLLCSCEATLEGTTMRRLHRGILAVLVGLGLSVFMANTVRGGPYVQTDLVSDIPGLAAITDPNLVNPWGISHSSTSPFWISNQGTNTTTLYAVTGSTGVTKTIINPPAGFVAIPTTAIGPQGPTGQVNNANTSSFLVGNGEVFALLTWPVEIGR